jgi:hypothetical protein
MMDLAEAQALFSHLEKFIRQGDLVPGPEKNRLMRTIPAFELPTGDPTARVLARRLRGREEWLITAWASTGDSREVSVTVPGLGNVTVLARPSGSVYHATLKQALNYEPPITEVELLDKDGMRPTASFRGLGS